MPTATSAHWPLKIKLSLNKLSVVPGLDQNARTTVFSRELIVKRVRQEGEKVSEVARQFGVIRPDRFLTGITL